GLVRWVNLDTHGLGLSGGGGTKAPKVALGGKATDALLDPASVAVAPDGTVAFVEATSQQVLSIDPTSGNLNRVAASRHATGAADCGTLALDTCSSGCEVFYDAGGSAFVGGPLCGTDPVAASAGTTTPGVARAGPGVPPSLVRIAGRVPGVLPG